MKILTFDIEDWFHFLDNSLTRTETDWARYEPRIDRTVEHILETLQRHRQQATFFCLGWIARRHPQVVRSICSAGHELGSHSDMHRLVYEQTRQEFENDLRRSIDVLEQTSGQKVRMYRAPGFSIITGFEWAFQTLAEAGIEIDCSVFPAPRSHGGLPAWDVSTPAVLETSSGVLRLFPMNIIRALGRSVVFSGGGYFRLCPATLLKGLFDRETYIMTYFHPRDFDAKQPLLPGLSGARRFRSYVGVSTAMAKLERLLELFEFHDVSSAESRIDWQSVPHFALRKEGSVPVRIH